ncbi:hypothetical protein ACP70R_016615 [Stipagrostis hirtigluma subsp. patula]
MAAAAATGDEGLEKLLRDCTASPIVSIPRSRYWTPHHFRRPRTSPSSPSSLVAESAAACIRFSLLQVWFSLLNGSMAAAEAGWTTRDVIFWKLEMARIQLSRGRVAVRAQNCR